MALVYEYKDEFIVDSIPTEDLEAEELDAIAQVDVLAVTTEPFRGKLVQYIVYMELALQQMEAEGMKEKYDSYSRKFTSTLSLATKSSPSSVSTIPLGRG